MAHPWRRAKFDVWPNGPEADCQAGHFDQSTTGHTSFFYATQSGYDAPADQITNQPALHGALAEALKTFFDDLAARNLTDETLILIWSE